MLTTQELTSLLSFLDDHTAPMEAHTERLFHSFKPEDYFRLASGVYLLIQNRVLSLASRLNAYYMLWFLYKHEPLPSNPFFPAFWMPLDCSGATETAFLWLIISNVIQSVVAGRSAAEFMKFRPEDIPTPSVDLRGLISANQNKHPSATSAFTRAGITPPVVDDIDDFALYRSDFSLSNPESARQDVLQTLLQSHSLQPSYLRPPPPLLKPSAEELLWLNPEEERLPLWMPSNTNKELLLQAAVSPLPSSEVEALRTNIKADPKIVQDVIDPTKLPALVENNFSVAVEVLHQMILSSDRADPYLTALTEMPITLHSIEAVSELSGLTALPGSFLQSYISKCIDTCQSLKDKYVQGRMIRLVCVFLQSLVKKKSDIKSLNSTIQSFCVENSSNKEAATLFKLLKEHS